MLAKPRYVLLDLMRIFAAYWVLVHHWTATDGFMIHLKQKYTIPDLPIILEEVLAGGYLGVDIFFILSGIVISKSAIHRNWVDFSQSRFIRLFPAYFVITLLSIAVAPITMLDHPPISQLVMSLTGLQWFYGYPTIVGPAWTLFFEIRFYIMIAIMIAIFRDIDIRTMKNIAIVWGIFLILTPNLNSQQMNFLVMPDYGVYFCFGIILGITSSTKEFKKNLPLIIFGFSIAWVRLQARYNGNHFIFERESVSALILLVVVYISMHQKDVFFVRGETMHKWVRNIALATYPLYLVHEPLGMPLVAWMTNAGVPVILSLFTATIIVTIFSVFCAVVLERKIGEIIRQKIFLKTDVQPRSVSLSSPGAQRPVVCKTAREI